MYIVNPLLFVYLITKSLVQALGCSRQNLVAPIKGSISAKLTQSSSSSRDELALISQFPTTHSHHIPCATLNLFLTT